jgi:hypothetical protein
VLGEEVAAREGHGAEARGQAARFQAVKTLDDFDFARGLKRETVLHLAQVTRACSKARAERCCGAMRGD